MSYCHHYRSGCGGRHRIGQGVGGEVPKVVAYRKTHSILPRICISERYHLIGAGQRVAIGADQRVAIGVECPDIRSIRASAGVRKVNSQRSRATGRPQRERSHRRYDWVYVNIINLVVVRAGGSCISRFNSRTQRR